MVIATSDGTVYKDEFDYTLGRPMPSKSEDDGTTAPLMTGNKPLSEPEPALNKVFGPAPPAARAFLSTILGDHSPITEKFFNPNELDILRNTAETQLSKGKNVIGYGDYGEKDPFAEGSQAAMHALTDLPHSLAFTLGMARVKKEEDGTIVINDKYDFAVNKEKSDALKAKGSWEVLKMLGYGMIDNGLLGVGNVIGNLLAPENGGRDVEIRIPPKGSSASTMPLTGTQELTDALKSTPGMEVPGKRSQTERQAKRAGVEDTFEAGVKHAAGAFMDLLKVPGDVYQGKRDVSDPDIIARMADLAMTFGVGGLVTAPVRETGVGLFGGRMSKSAVEIAEGLEAKAISPTAVKEWTGLERGADGMWRREFSDSASTYNEYGFNRTSRRIDPIDPTTGKLATVEYGQLGDVLKHDRLYEAYPEAKNIRVVMSPISGTTQGYYASGRNTIVISDKFRTDPEGAKSTLLHEVQHWIQDKEGFSLAVQQNVPKELADQFKGYILRKYGAETVKNIVNTAKEGNIKEARALAKKLLDNADYKLYRSLSSEVEAFNVQKRAHMTADEIRKSPGRMTEDIPRYEQIIVDKNKNVTMGSPVE